MYYDYPKQAYFGKMIAKSKIYDHANATSFLKEKFVSQIDKIIWQYKLAPETINLKATSTVTEIQVFDIRLRGNELDEALLRVIDKAIPFPIFYQIYRGSEVKIKAAYKRPSDADKNKWVVESYFESAWLDIDTAKAPLPLTLDLGKLYEQMMKALLPQEVTKASTAISLKEQVELIDKIKAKKKAYEKLKAKRDREQQFNRKATLNSELKILKKELDMLQNFDT